MKSAYGRQTPPPDYELACVEPGSPMGELLRRYWQPVCTSDELNDLSKKVKLLCCAPTKLPVGIREDVMLAPLIFLSATGQALTALAGSPACTCATATAGS